METREQVLKIYKDNGDKMLVVKTHPNHDDYRLSFKTSVWDYSADDWVSNNYTTRKYISEASMLQAFAALVNECLFDGSKFDLNVY